MGWSFRGDDHPSLRSIAGALLVASASDSVKCPISPLSIAQQLLALGFLVGCTFAPNLKTFAGRYHPLGT
jgi:hypothetical protein